VSEKTSTKIGISTAGVSGNLPMISTEGRAGRRAAEMRLRLKCEISTLQPLPMHAYEVRPRKDHRGVDLVSAS